MPAQGSRNTVYCSVVAGGEGKSILSLKGKVGLPLDRIYYSHSTARPYHLVIIRTLNSLFVLIFDGFQAFQTVLNFFVAIL